MTKAPLRESSSPVAAATRLATASSSWRAWASVQPARIRPTPSRNWSCRSSRPLRPVRSGTSVTGAKGVELQADDRPAEPRRGHADHGEVVAVELEVPSDDAGVAGEAALPIRVAQHDHGRALVFVPQREQAAQGRPHAEHVEVVAARHRGPDALDRAAFATQPELGERRCRDVERPRLGAPVAQVGVRHGPGGVAGAVRADRDDPAEVRHGGKRPQHEGVHPRVHRRVGADAQPERQDGDQRQAGALAQPPQPETQVLQQ